jgi:hypothetical protein
MTCRKRSLRVDGAATQTAFIHPRADSGLTGPPLTGISAPCTTRSRRVHSFPDSSDASELKFLVAALNADPALASLNDRLTTVQTRLVSYADEHAMTISLWALGYPSVRATARHLSGGVAVVECVVDDTPNVDLHAYHWIDDHDRSVRLSRRRSFPHLFDSTDLDVALHEAQAFLLSSPAHASFERTALGPTDQSTLASDAAFWTALSILR